MKASEKAVNDKVNQSAFNEVDRAEPKAKEENAKVKTDQAK